MPQPQHNRTQGTNRSTGSSGTRRSDNSRGGRGGGSGGRRGGRRRSNNNEVQDEFDAIIIDLSRVTRVMAGGKRMRFRACVVVGDHKGRIGMGVKKGADVQLAVQKATDYAKRHIMTIPMRTGTIPHPTMFRFGGAQVLLKPAKPGTGIIAGGPVRVIMSVAGVENIVAKMQGSNNKINNVTAVFQALAQLHIPIKE